MQNNNVSMGSLYLFQIDYELLGKILMSLKLSQQKLWC